MFVLGKHSTIQTGTRSKKEFRYAFPQLRPVPRRACAVLSRRLQQQRPKPLVWQFQARTSDRFIVAKHVDFCSGSAGTDAYR
jgi:hypothetical protein